MLASPVEALAYLATATSLSALSFDAPDYLAISHSVAI